MHFYEEALCVFRYIKQANSEWRITGLQDKDLSYVDDNGKTLRRESISDR